MTAGKQIIVLALIGMGVWFVHHYESELNSYIDEAKPPTISALTRAQKHFYASQYDAAVAQYRIALTEDISEDNRRLAYFRIAACLDKARKTDEALTAYQEAIERYPNSPEAQRARKDMEKLRLETGR